MNEKKASDNNIKNIVRDLCIIIHPFTPHLSEEIWEALGCEDFCANAKWPQITRDNTVNTIELPIQINGKLKGLVSAKKEDKEEFVIKKAKDLPGVNKTLNDKEVIKIIYIPGKILNIVIK